MRLSRFLAELFEAGHVRLDDGTSELDEEDRGAANAILVERSRVVAADFPEPVPDLNLGVAVWAGWQFCSACHFVLLRDAPIEAVRERLCSPAPSAEPATQIYSVDLVWRFLPDLDRLTATLSPRIRCEKS